MGNTSNAAGLVLVLSCCALWSGEHASFAKDTASVRGQRVEFFSGRQMRASQRPGAHLGVFSGGFFSAGGLPRALSARAPASQGAGEVSWVHWSWRDRAPDRFRLLGQDLRYEARAVVGLPLGVVPPLFLFR